MTPVPTFKVFPLHSRCQYCKCQALSTSTLTVFVVFLLLHKSSVVGLELIQGFVSYGKFGLPRPDLDGNNPAMRLVKKRAIKMCKGCSFSCLY